MSNKFTGITSAGSAIPVYDKDAHEALSSKLDTTAFSSVSGEFATVDDVVAAVSGKADTSAIPSLDGYATQEWVGEQGYLTEVPESAVSGFATHEEVESAISGKADTSALSDKADTSGVIEYRGKPSSGEIYAAGNRLCVNEIAGSDLAVLPNIAMLFVRGAVTAASGGLTAANLTATSGGLTAANLAADAAGLSAASITSNPLGLTAAALRATTGNFSANGISAGDGGSFCIKCSPEVFSGGNATGFTFSSMSTAFGSAVLTSAQGNSIVQMCSPKFEAKNVSGAGFSIEASGARGYDHNGNVIWDTSKPAKLIGWNNYKGTAIDPRADGINGGIIATVYPDNIPLSMQLSAAPYTYMNGYGFYAVNSYGASLSLDTSQSKISLEHAGTSSTATMDTGDVLYKKYNSTTSATDTWSLTGSVQKREIECDSATSAITAIAGSAIGGGGASYSAGEGIDITNDVISVTGKADTSALSGFISGSNTSGYLISSFSDGSSYGGPSFIYKNEAKPNEIILFLSGNRIYTSGLSGKIDPTTISSWNTVTAKLDKSAFSAVSGNFLTEVPASAISGKADASAFELDGNGHISAYNGSAFAGGGGEVPEGVMVESAVGFNAVNEISGYNGSAIAQYGAEKQWLVHDDTLVHLSNSAQYALGVAIDNVARLLGVDETVLFNDSGNVGKSNISAYTLSESVNNFDRVRISFTRGQNFYGDQCFEYYVNSYPKMATLECYDAAGTNMYRYFCSFSIDGTTFTELSGKCGYTQTVGGSATVKTSNWLHPYKIIGIGRKQ